ncbi:GNAT family N-acetyltransferase [Dickeya dadantii]|uniref:GNAT family N-acetyltransferase n=1 Tax=Dickeya dadantii TaxID=204038 RepID=UPI000981A447|nr:GNAT family N-acetyltransferase [Dickeya dadantii]OOC14887.1 GNAT family N-acetyltransferase [Dickeya dadantii]
MNLHIVRIDRLSHGLEALIAESQEQGFRFLRRLQLEYQSGVNRFRLPGEGLLAAFDGKRLVAIGGVNQQPYNGQRTGRLRRFYVAADYRRQGVGRELLAAIETFSGLYFHELHLFTDTDEAARFYQRLGYLPVNHPHTSHSKKLTVSTAD